MKRGEATTEAQERKCADPSPHERHTWASGDYCPGVCATDPAARLAELERELAQHDQRAVERIEAIGRMAKERDAALARLGALADQSFLTDAKRYRKMAEEARAEADHADRVLTGVALKRDEYRDEAANWRKAHDGLVKVLAESVAEADRLRVEVAEAIMEGCYDGDECGNRIKVQAVLSAPAPSTAKAGFYPPCGKHFEHHFGSDDGGKTLHRYGAVKGTNEREICEPAAASEAEPKYDPDKFVRGCACSCYDCTACYYRTNPPAPAATACRIWINKHLVLAEPLSTPEELLALLFKEEADEYDLFRVVRPTESYRLERGKIFQVEAGMHFNAFPRNINFGAPPSPSPEPTKYRSHPGGPHHIVSARWCQVHNDLIERCGHPHEFVEGGFCNTHLTYGCSPFPSAKPGASKCESARHTQAISPSDPHWLKCPDRRPAPAPKPEACPHDDPRCKCHVVTPFFCPIHGDAPPSPPKEPCPGHQVPEVAKGFGIIGWITVRCISAGCRAKPGASL